LNIVKFVQRYRRVRPETISYYSRGQLHYTNTVDSEATARSRAEFVENRYHAGSSFLSELLPWGTLNTLAVNSNRQPLQMPDTSDSLKHVWVIDVVRGFAALSVALLHIRLVTWIGIHAYWASHGFDLSMPSIFAYLSFPVVWGSIGVPILFVVSGYVIHRSSSRTVVNLAHSQEFWLRRFVRIYPTLVSALLVTLACDLLSRHYGHHERLGDLSPRNAMANLLATVGVWGSPYGSNGALWSLSIEIQFYAIYPLALMVWRKIGPTPMLGAALTLTAIGYFLFQRYGLQFFMTYYFSWWLGAYVADRQGMTPAERWQLGTGLLIVALGCAVFFASNQILPHMIWSIGFALILYYLVNRELCRQTLPPRRGLRGVVYGAFGHCGNFSYSLYAIHLPVALAVNGILFDGQQQTNILWMLLVLPIAVLGGYLLYRAVEMPSIALLTRLPR
jgi:peptidoglycan/LPS O-acetylase OafA/YrhL